MRVLLFGTHPHQYNGYSKIVHELANGLACNENVHVKVFGFQNLHTPNRDRVAATNARLEIYDAAQNEDPKDKGFGIPQVKKVVEDYQPDVCIVYNDMSIITMVVTEIRKSEHTCKIVAYVDQVYLHQKKAFISFLNANVDTVMAFTPYWRDNLLKQGVDKPMTYLRHGFNNMEYFPVPRDIARAYFNLQKTDFIILNMNRNQPRKRWDTCLKAFAEIVHRYPNEPIKLLIATAVQGAWNLLEIFERELAKRGLTIQDGLKHLIIIDQPQRLTDREVNILYNVADIGINTCDGEGFGLCNFEQAGVGVPQIVPRLGGFQDFLNDDSAIMCEPIFAYYVDNSRDSVCGEALLCDFEDFVSGIETYYFNAELRKKHGEAARKRILSEYAWSDIVNELCNIVGVPEPVMLDSPVKGVVHDPLNDVKRAISVLTSNAGNSNETAKPKGKKHKMHRELKELKQTILALQKQLNDNTK